MSEPPKGFFGRVFSFLIPPPRWRLPVIIMLGALAGLGAVVAYISNAVSYLSNDPQACMNCHIMAPQYATWQRGSHGRVATCNDCPVPHDNVFRTYSFKARDGMRHAFMFTFRMEPQVIRVHEAGMSVIQENCIRCHTKQIGMTKIQFVSYDMAAHGEGRLCWDCHRETPHGRVNSLSSVPYARVPIPTPVTPEWLGDSKDGVHNSQQKSELK